MNASPRSLRLPLAAPAATRGFTLIEMMIVVAIIAVIAAVAIPSYQDSIWKGKRGEAKAAMLKALQAEERYYSQNNTYVAYAANTPPTGGAFPGYSADTLANSRYTIAVVQAGVSGMCTDNDLRRCAIVVATVYGTGADPKCGTTLTMDTIGNKSSAITNAICWK